MELLGEHPSRGLGLEVPAVDHRDRNRGHPRPRGTARRYRAWRHDELARAQDPQLVLKHLPALDAGVFGYRELAGRQVHERGANPIAPVWPECHQESGLARVEVVRVEQRPRRHDTHDFAPDDAFGLPRVFDLLADRDAIALSHEPGEIAVNGMKGHAAHRNRPAGRVFRARGQREIERARRDQGVLEEHLVEVAHAKEHDGIAILPLGVMVLTHGGRERARARSRRRRVVRGNGHQIRTTRGRTHGSIGAALLGSQAIDRVDFSRVGVYNNLGGHSRPRHVDRTRQRGRPPRRRDDRRSRRRRTPSSRNEAPWRSLRCSRRLRCDAR